MTRSPTVSAGLVAASMALLAACAARPPSSDEATGKPAGSTEATPGNQRSDSGASEEWLGPRDGSFEGTEHPLDRLMATQISAPRPQLVGKHPRVFFDSQALTELRTKSRTTHRQLWATVRQNLRAFTSEPPRAPAQARRSQNVVGLGIAEAALAYAIEGTPKYLEAAKRWMDAAVSYEVWGYEYSKPNVDLAAGHLLFGLAWGYDVLYDALTPEERRQYRDKLVRQATLLYDYYRPRPGRTFAYSQNHVYIPMAGLGVAAYALYGEVPEAVAWAKLSRAIMERSLDTYSADGYFYESFEYFVFAVPWLVVWTTAHAHVTGEDLFDRPGFRSMHRYLAHAVLPDGVNVFDFGDAYSGSETRRRRTRDYERTHPGGKLHSNYSLLYAMASRFKDPQAQGVAHHFRDLGHVSWYDFMAMLWYDADVPAAPIESLEPYHHFEDHGVVFYRSDWTSNATAFAFKCGPPEGRAAEQRKARFQDWHLSSGHAHPDANSFIWFANGEYITGDSGYSGVPRTDQHNTLLVNGVGQRFTEAGHNAFKGASLAQLNGMSLSVHALGPGGVRLVGDATAAYPGSLGVERFTREVTLVGNDALRIEDRVEASSPTTFTILFHSDSPVESSSSGRLTSRLERANLEIDVEGASGAGLSSAVEPNWMTAPGRPGSVQKGEREARGYRARVSNATPSKTAHFVSELRVKQRKR